MKKLLYRSYHYLFFKIYYKGHIPFLSRQKSKYTIESPIFILWLRYSTEYIIQKWLEDFYEKYKQYDGKDTQGLLQFPKKLMEISNYGYLYIHIWMGYHPTLSRNPIKLERILYLNPHKSDMSYAKFLERYLTNYWHNYGKCVTKSTLDNILYSK